MIKDLSLAINIRMEDQDEQDADFSWELHKSGDPEDGKGTKYKGFQHELK